MNRLIYFLFLLVLISSCGSDQGTITGEITGADGQMVYLDVEVDRQPMFIDSAVVKNGKFSLNVKEPKLGFYRMSLSNSNAVILIIDKDDKIHYTGDAVNLNENYTVKGSYHSELLHNFLQGKNRLEDEGSEVQEQINRFASQGDAEARNRAIDRYNELNKEYIEFVEGFIREHNSSPAVLYAISLVNPMNDLELYKLVEQGLKGIFEDSPYYVSLVGKIKETENQIENQKLLAEQQKMMEQAQQSLSQGSVAPDIRLEDPNGKVRALSELRGKYVLIDFWASWCKPCRIENPNVVRMYNQYKNKGFEIYAVSLDRTKEHWLKAIQDDGLGWIHVSDLKFWNSDAARLYNVNSIPYTILLDKEGRIVAKNLRGPALENKLKEVLG
jgi:peroxiredoxin